MVGRSSRLSNGFAVESLQALAEHGAVTFLPKAPSDVNHTCWVYTEQIAVIGQVVDGAERQAVDDRSHAFGRGVRHDVSRLNEIVSPQRADRAPLAIRPEYVLAETLLVKPHSDFSECVPAHIRSGDGAPRLRVDPGQALVQ